MYVCMFVCLFVCSVRGWSSTSGGFIQKQQVSCFPRRLVQDYTCGWSEIDLLSEWHLPLPLSFVPLSLPFSLALSLSSCSP